jgi:excisionase family DNA binding protein
MDSEDEHEMSTETNIYPPLVSVTKTMWLLGERGRGTVYRLIESGEIESVKSGSRRLVVTSSILAYIESLKSA